MLLLISILQQLNLIQDVETRWNSTLEMIRRLLKILPAVTSTLCEYTTHHYLIPTSHDIGHMQELQTLLLPFEIATKMVSSEASPTCSMIKPLLESILQRDLKECSADTPLLQKGKKAIREYLVKSYQKPQTVVLLNMASALDPRFKNLSWLQENKQQEIKENLVKEAVRRFPKSSQPTAAFKVKVEPPDTTQSTISSQSAQTLPAPLPTLPADYDDDENDQNDEEEKVSEPPEKKLCSESFFDVIFVKEEKPPMDLGLEEKARRELERYNEEDIAATTTNPLEWWKCRSGIYPMLSNLMQHYLCIPGTSVPSERVFSAAGNIVNKKRCSLHSTNVDMLVFLHANHVIDWVE